MNVEEAIRAVNSASETSVLVAKPPLTWGAEAMYVEMTPDGGIPDSVADAGYETILDKEDIQHLIGEVENKKIGARALAEFVIHYATYDEYPEWIQDIPDA